MFFCSSSCVFLLFDELAQFLFLFFPMELCLFVTLLRVVLLASDLLLTVQLIKVVVGESITRNLNN